MRIEPASDLFKRLDKNDDGNPNRDHGDSRERPAAALAGYQVGLEGKMSMMRYGSDWHTSDMDIWHSDKALFSPIRDANVKPLLCVVVSSGPIWVADAECNGASIDAVDGRERVCSFRG
jgi:hypothetical protein